MLGLPSGGPRPMPGIPCGPPGIPCGPPDIPCGPPGIGPVGVLEPSGCGLFGLCFCMAVLEVAGPLWEDGGILGPPGPMLGPPGPMLGPPGPISGPPGPCHPGGMELLLAPWPGILMPG